MKEMAKRMAALTPTDAKELLVILEEDHGLKHVELPFFMAEEEPIVAEVQTLFNFILVTVEDRIPAIKLIKELTGLSLNDSKNKLESLPSIILNDVSRENAEKAAERFKKLKCNTKIK